MHCASCAMVIEGELEDAGAKAKCNFGKQTLEVEYNEDNLDETKIKQILEKVGYRMGTV